MGSSSSKGKKYQDTSKYGDLYFQLENSVYQPGETVSGTIFLNLTSAYPGNQLFLKFKGEEAVYTVTTSSHYSSFTHHTSTTHYLNSDENDIIQKTIPVHSWKELSPGQFSIPFSFLLPPDLPGSFQQKGERYLAFIKY